MAMGLYQILKEAFTAVPTFDDLNDEFYDGLEEALILADVGADTAADTVAQLRKRVKERFIGRMDEVKDALRDILKSKLEVGDSALVLEGKPAVRGDEEGKESEFPLNPDGPATAFVFNTVADQYGKNSYFKVISGAMEDTHPVANVRTGASEKLGNMFFPKGKDNTKTSKVCCGDIGVFTKLASVKTGDTLGLPGKTVRIKGMTYDEPMYKMAVYAKVKGTEDKIANGLVKLKEEDESFTYGNDPETKELIIAGVGDMQLSVLMAKLQSKYKVEAVLKPAKIAYRETIKKKVEIHGRHKKQSGGHGQFGDVYIRFEPQSESEEMIFADETVGGCVPKNFIPSVEKGLRNCVGKGVLAGYPVVFLKATLYFGSYHPVDSSDMAFQTAAGIAYKEGLPTAGPTLLEPIGELKVLIPDSNMGDVIGDLNKRRGRVMGMNPDPENPGYQIVEAEVPVGEMTSYSIDLRAMSQGRGSYTLKFVRYEEVPQMNQAKIIEDAKKEEEKTKLVEEIKANEYLMSVLKPVLPHFGVDVETASQ